MRWKTSDMARRGLVPVTGFLVCIVFVTICDHVDGGGQQSCLPSQWLCPVNQTCIPLSQVCDNRPHCPSGDDEGITCGTSRCNVLSCDYQCHPTPTGGVCTCQAGYQVDPADGRTCIDYDECTAWGSCDQKCVNSQGSYTCSCESPYVLSGTSKCIVPDALAMRLIVSLEDLIFNLSVGTWGGGRPTPQPVIASYRPVAIDFDYQERRLFWANADGKLYESDIGGTNIREIPTTALQTPISLAYDWLARNLYVLEQIGMRIDVLSLRTRKQRNLIADGLSLPTSIAVDPNVGFMFFSYATGIDRASMDGSHRVTLIPRNASIYQPNGLVLDYVNRRLYWADSRLDVIESVDYTGLNRVRIKSGLPNPVKLALFEDMVYVTDTTHMQIRRIGKYNPSHDEAIYTNTSSRLRDLVAYHAVRQPEGHSLCPGARCQHLCVTTPPTDAAPQGYRCMCTTGYELNSDQTTCSRIQKFLIFTSRSAVRGVPLEPVTSAADFNSDAMQPVFSSKANFIGLDYYAAEQYIYYSDVRQDTMYRIKTDGSGKELVVPNGLGSVEGIAFDWISQLVYYTDGVYGTISVVNHRNISQQRTLVENLGSLRSIVVHPAKGYLYFTDWQRSSTSVAYIGRISSNGMNLARLTNTSLGWPNGVTLDYQNDLLYWCDAMDSFAGIYYMNLNGGPYRKLMGHSILHPFALVLHHDYIYYTDWEYGSIFRISKSHQVGDPEVRIRSDIFRLHQIRVFDRALQQPIANHQCLSQNGGCSHFCFPMGGLQRACGCPYGMKLSATNQQMCISDPNEPPFDPCQSWEFKCNNSRCIYSSYRCDGDNDCFDNSDEDNCPSIEDVTCRPGYFKCNSTGRCVSNFWLCDGDDDCGDLSDEQNCGNISTCHSWEFKCDNNLCIRKEYKCDRDNDCGDGSDERGCVYPTCSPEVQYECPSGLCLPASWLCDGTNDCGDMADERGCNCSGRFVCGDGLCLSMSLRCDGDIDCSDESDEQNCPTPPPGSCRDDEFRCAQSGRCIPKAWMCDDQNDCPDQSDETDPICSAEVTCQPNQYSCGDYCIPDYYVCDDYDDCPDGRDEASCTPVDPPDCPFGEHRCPETMNTCILLSKFCDGTADCPGGRDEGPLCNEDSCSVNNGGCSDGCETTPFGALCYCPVGENLNGTKACVDIDECASMMYCSQYCNNTKGSYSCSCDDGYTLSPDKRTCRVADNTPAYLIVSNRGNILRVNMRSSSFLVIDVPGAAMVSGVDFDKVEDRIYWADVAGEKIYSAFVNGSDAKVIVNGGMSVPEGMAVDWVGRNLYWVDYGLETIEVAKLNGSWRTVLITDNVTNPRAIVLDPRDRYMFWSDWGVRPRIERAGMDGSNRITLLTDRVYYPNSLAIDFPTRKLFYADSYLDLIGYINYDGSGLTMVLHSDHFIVHPYGMTIFEDQLYWTDRSLNQISSCNKFNCTDKAIKLRRLNSPLGLVAHHPVRQPSAFNPCSSSPCSHHCLLAPEVTTLDPGYTCACPVGMKLTGSSCVAVNTTFLMLSRDVQISGMDFHGSGEALDAFVPVTGISNAYDVDYDSQNHMIYWSDLRNGTIKKVGLYGGEVTSFLPHGILGVPHCIAIDWLARNLYFGNINESTIEVVQMDGDKNYRKILVSNDGSDHGVCKPKSLAVDPGQGQLYWLDEGCRGVPMKLAKVNMDGSGAKTLYTAVSGGVQFLTIDLNSKTLYWTEQYTPQIMKYDINTGTASVFLANLDSPSALTLGGQYLFYYDTAHESITRVYASNGQGAKVIRNNFVLVKSMKAFDSTRHLQGQSPCTFNNGNCEHLCLPSGENTRTCACGMGFFTTATFSCQAVTSYAVVSQLSVIRGVPTSSGSTVEPMVPIAENGMLALAIDVHVVTSTIYWADFSKRGIYSIKVDGSDFKAIVTSGVGSSGIRGLAIDWFAGNLYFTNAFSINVAYLEVSRMDGTFRRVLVKFKGNTPRALAVNPIKRYLYWCDYGQRPQIERSRLDGTNRTTIVQTGVTVPRDIAIDYMTHDIYWVDSAVDAIQKVSFSGGRREYIRSGLPSPFGIVVFQESVIWVDRNLRKVLKASKLPGNTSTPEVLRANLNTVRDIAMFDRRAQPVPSIPSGCSVNNGGCEQLCFSLPGVTTITPVTCQCATGRLSSDGRTCEEPTEYLVYAMGSEIRSLHLDPEDRSLPFQPIVNLSFAVALDFDYANKEIYFSQIGSRRLSRVYTDGSGGVRDFLVHGNVTAGGHDPVINSPEGVAFDWVNKKVYWSDSVLGEISAITLDGRDKVVVLRTDLPRAVVVDPCRGFLYWTDWSTPGAYIGKATMAGNQQQRLITTDIQHPNGLTIDFEDNVMYWVDALRNTIERANTLGGNRQVLLSSEYHPFAITLFGEHIYWTDWEFAGVFRADKYTGGNVVELVNDLPSYPFDIHVYTGQRQSCTSSPCLEQNGYCTDVCHPGADGTAECLCTRNGTKLANNGRMCVPANSTCHSSQFTCTSGQCIFMSYACDVDRDCDDGSDENPIYCGDHTCTSDQFTCNNRRCIRNDMVCDHFNDCRDNSDEQGCSYPECTAEELRCTNQKCVPLNYLCDGYDDCRDGNATDERNCPPTTCAPGREKCSHTNICVLSAWMCDGDNDCGDNSDEDPLFCATRRCTPISEYFQCNNGRCIPNSWHCDGHEDCPTGEDEPDTCGQPGSTCYGNQFTCDNGRCINPRWVCDTSNDCGDNSDEDLRHECHLRTCRPDQFTCQSNINAGYYGCIQRAFVCDGDRDCMGGEDEEQSCPPSNCTSTQFKCDNGVCIPSYWTCDHENDCGDGSDERQNCAYPTCAPDEYTCSNKRCIPQSYKCDGQNDCWDNSDERPSDCFSATPTCPGNQFRCTDGTCIRYELVCNKLADCPDNSDEMHCNVNECDNSTNIAYCQHICINTVTSYRCDCHPGFQLQTDMQSCRDVNECQTIAGVCSQLCVNTLGSYTCKCGEGYQKEPSDDRVCKKVDNIDPYLLFGNRYYVRNLTMDGNSYSLVAQGFGFVGAIDVDMAEKMIYYTDLGASNVGRMAWNGTNKTTLVKNIAPAPRGLAVDWIGRKLYWVDFSLKAMLVSELNGTKVLTLASTDMSNPESVVVHPLKGYVFWTDWGLSPYIGRMGMDGTSRTKLVEVGLGWPTALTIDYITGNIWWCDGHLNMIEYVDFSGQHRHVVLSGTVPFPSGIAVFGDWMYWTDRDTRTVERANRYTGTNRSTLVTTVHSPQDLIVVHPLSQPQAKNPCGDNNGGCSHLCLIAPGGASYSCMCPDYFVLGPDSRTCFANCTSLQFRCGVTDDRCIPLLWKCDGEEDCKDGSDEPDDCPASTCQRGQFTCDNLNCTYSWSICDGIDQCGDNSDERNCDSRQCEDFQFRCSSGQCIPSGWQCDEDEDCDDGSDEAVEHCATRTCSADQFTCTNKRCIPKRWQCDADDDCGDGSDEEGCVETECPAGWFNCATNYVCVPSYTLCNGVDNCRDNSDELPANCPACHPTGDFTCANNKCISKSWMCDFFDDCGDGSDEDVAMCAPLYRECSESEYRCANHQCISRQWICDHDEDCQDGSDEQNCPAHQCNAGQFKCASGHCVSDNTVCDGVRDCRDASDEANCPTRFPGGRYCKTSQFQCANSVCIPLEWRCDADDDCGDGSDETLDICSSINCSSITQFRCRNLRCIPRYRVCDKVDNCGDGSDENNHTLCSPTTVTCRLNQFKCASKECIDGDKVCDNVADCSDASDENGCHKNPALNDNCQTNNGGCEQECTPLTPDGYYCHCRNGFSISSSDRKSCQDVDECAAWGNYCPQVCVNSKGTYGCLCVSPFTSVRGANGTECRVQGVESIFLFSMRWEIRQYRPNTKDELYNDLFANGQRIAAIDYDYSKQIIYWSDTSLRKIQRAAMPTDPTHQPPSQDLQIADLEEPNGLAVDWVGSNLYWTDGGKRAVYLTKLDGTYRRTLVKDQLVKPGAIAVNPLTGWMFWVDTGANPKIEAAWMSGENRRQIVNSRLGNPTGITIDYSMGGRIYWSDSKANIIESCRPDGTDRVVVISQGINNPYSLDVFGNYLYWVSQVDGNLVQHDKFGRGVNVTIKSGLTAPNDIKVYHPNRYNTSVSSPCASMSCWPLCVIVPMGGKCLCPDGSDFRDTAQTVCDAVDEPAKPAPPASCFCQNGGNCTLEKNSYVCLCPALFSGDKCETCLCKNEGRCMNGQCSCPGGYTGSLCQKPVALPTKDTAGDTPAPQTGKVQQTETTTVIAIVVPIMVVAIVIIAGVGVFFYMRKKGSFKSSGEFREGNAGAVSFSGDSVDLGGANAEYDTAMRQTSFDTSSGLPDSDLHTNFSNPLYETLGTSKSANNNTAVNGSQQPSGVDEVKIQFESLNSESTD